MTRSSTDTRPSPIGPDTDAQAGARVLLAQQVALHGTNSPWAVVGALTLGLLIVGLHWPVIPHGMLLGWLAALLLVLAWRGGLWAWQRSARGARLADRTWSRLYRLNLLAHGLVWAAASGLPMQAPDPLHLALLVMVLTCLCASNFILHALDLTAALLFGVPAMLALAWCLLSDGATMQPLMALTVLLALSFFALTGQRAHRLALENAALRLAERRQTHLLRALVEHTSEGFWFIDTQACTVDANPAMCQMLGLPRAALVGRSIFDFIDAANRATFEHELARRAHGSGGGGCEIALRRPDGSLVECFIQVTPIVGADGQPAGSVGLWTDITERKRTERQLQDTSDALGQKSRALEHTLSIISQGIVHFDSNGLLRSHNRRVLELLDLPEHLFNAQTTRTLLRAFQHQRGDIGPDTEVLDTDGRPFPQQPRIEDLPDLYLRRTRTGRLVEVRTRHLPDGGMVRTFTDVTPYIEAQRRLAAREQEQRDLLEALPGYIIVTDESHHYVYANQRFADLIGRPRESIIGQHAREVLGDARFQQVEATLDQLRLGEPMVRESNYPATAWRPRIVLQVTHALGLDAATGQRRVYAFAIDISTRKEAEAAMQAARDEAERANQAKSQFLSSMSHELRTPLNAILGFGHLLATDTVQPLSAVQRQQMEEILGGARHLLELINEVLDLAVVESGSVAIHLQPVALAPVLADALSLLQPLAASRHITLPSAATGLPPGAAVQADPVRLKQVLLNLLGNAIKYNHPQGRVTVHCQGLAAGDDAPGSAGWRIGVHDTGPGLDAAQQARLFGAFERLGADAGRVEGTGLGLALSRGLVRAMGGEIGVQSQPGHGSTFWVQLPPADAAQATLAAQATATPPGARRRAEPGRVPVVLYIEDNPVNLLLMEALFERLPDLQLRTASDPLQGLADAVAAPPDLLLLDIQLPGMDGFELLALLQADPRTHAVPVIAVSADAMPDTLQRGQAAGFADYLTKPIDLERLVGAVRTVLARAAG